MASENAKPPSSLSLWLEEALPGWLLPVLAIAAIAGVAGLYWTERLTEAMTGAVIVVAGALAASAFVLRPALDAAHDGRLRALAWGATAMCLLVSAVPAMRTMLPGDPLVDGTLGIEGETIPIPAGTDGSVRVLVNGKLKEGGEATVSFVITGTEQPVEGKLERTFSTTRIGRSGRARVSHDRNTDFLEARIPVGTKELRLDKLQGQLGARMQVLVYRELVPRWGVFALSVLALLLVAFADARLGLRGNAVIAGGIGLAFGMLVYTNATPSTAVGPAIGGLILGAAAGALAGSLAGWLVRKFVKTAKKRPSASAASVIGPADTGWVKEAALAAGFDAVGVARAEALDPAPLDRMLARGAHADMAWLATQREMRLDPTKLLPGARSVIALALRYFPPGSPGPAAPPGGPKVSVYALGRDYHRVVERKLWALQAAIEGRDPTAKTNATTDIAPTMEKVWAERAGVGWIGKNGCLITEKHGSWVFLATVLIDRELTPDAPHPDRCGACEACLPACPTGAIPEPGFVDARRCISFHTIERRGPIDPEMAPRLSGWVLGCDDCQTVCPWNREPVPSAEPDFVPRDWQRAPDLGELLALDRATFQARYYGTVFARARYEGLLRNAALAAGHAGDRKHREALARLAENPDEGVRAAAAWALGRMG
jgi:epoxyqueuosine reductase